MKIKASWHKQHAMPKNPTIEQHIEWHLEHVNNCNCRDIPEKLKAEMVKRNISLNSKN